jgi:hypothetical protein
MMPPQPLKERGKKLVELFAMENATLRGYPRFRPIMEPELELKLRKACERLFKSVHQNKTTAPGEYIEIVSS